MKQDHEIVDQPSPAVRETHEHPLADAELDLVSGGVCTGISIVRRDGKQLCIGRYPQ